MRGPLEDGRSHWFVREYNPDGKAEVAKEVARAQLVSMAEEDVKGLAADGGSRFAVMESNHQETIAHCFDVSHGALHRRDLNLDLLLPRHRFQGLGFSVMSVKLSIFSFPSKCPWYPQPSLSPLR